MERNYLNLEDCMKYIMEKYTNCSSNDLSLNKSLHFSIAKYSEYSVYYIACYRENRITMTKLATEH
ncbi:MAG: hypothetical protein NZ922_01025 [Candidatus Methanomethyliaceae archaeon]|nr:hypothetical protein [Candidatus Methanomethyliaceae archaeon]